MGHAGDLTVPTIKTYFSFVWSKEDSLCKPLNYLTWYPKSSSMKGFTSLLRREELREEDKAINSIAFFRLALSG
jgi:hypothetical protein